MDPLGMSKRPGMLLKNEGADVPAAPPDLVSLSSRVGETVTDGFALLNKGFSGFGDLIGFAVEEDANTEKKGEITEEKGEITEEKAEITVEKTQSIQDGAEVDAVILDITSKLQNNTFVVKHTWAIDITVSGHYKAQATSGLSPEALVKAKENNKLAVLDENRAWMHPASGLSHGEKIKIKGPDGKVREYTVHHLDDNQLKLLDTAFNRLYESQLKKSEQGSKNEHFNGEMKEKKILRVEVLATQGKKTNENDENQALKESEDLLKVARKLSKNASVKARDAQEAAKKKIKLAIERSLDRLDNYIHKHAISLEGFKTSHRLSLLAHG